MSASFWIKERNEILIENYGVKRAKEIGMMLGTSARGVYHQARRLGLKKQSYTRRKSLQSESDDKENKKFREMMDDLFVQANYLDD